MITEKTKVTVSIARIQHVSYVLYKFVIMTMCLFFSRLRSDRSVEKWSSSKEKFQIDGFRISRRYRL